MMTKKKLAVIAGILIITTLLGYLLDEYEGGSIAFIYAIIGIFIYIGLTVGIQFKSKDIEVAPSVDESISHIVIKLRVRAMRLKFASRVSLLLILISLMAGISIFIYADSFARNDIRYFVESESRNATEAVADSIIQSWLGNSRDKEQFENTISEILLAYQKDQDKKVTEWQSKNAVNKILNAIKPELIKDLPDDLVSKIESEYKKYRDLTEAKLSNNNSALISSVSTRIGSVFILLFLVQVLVSMYRYNTKLSAFYDARADVLEIVGKFESVPLEYISEMLSPDSLDFSKEGKGPADQAVELTKHLLSKSGK